MCEDRAVQFLEKPMIQQYKSDVGFRTLVEGVNENLYIIPKYQRKYRWDKGRVVGLVESLLRGLPIPPIYTCRNEENQLEILDGQQRVMSLFFYYIGFWMNSEKRKGINFSELDIGDRTFKEVLLEQPYLKELHIELKGKDGQYFNADYASLPVEVKRRVDYTTITVIEIKIDQVERREEVLRTIFANLNKRGMLLSDQEQRNGTYNCQFYDMLREFNRHNENWRKIWGRASANERDMELLLRFCALKKYAVLDKNGDFSIQGYNSSYVQMLDRFSNESTEFTEEESAAYYGSLKQFVSRFQIDKTFSAEVALLESFYIVYEKTKIRALITREVHDEIINSERYKETNRQGTIKMGKMNKRWKIVYEIWSKFDKQYPG